MNLLTPDNFEKIKKKLLDLSRMNREMCEKVVKGIMEIASKKDLAGFLTNFFSEKQIEEMSEQEFEKALQELIDQGVI